MENPLKNFKMPNLKMPTNFQPTGGLPKFSFPKINFNFSNFNIIDIIISSLLVFILIFSIVVNNELGNKIEAGNQENDKDIENIINAIPKPEIEKFIKIKEELEKFDNMKTSITIYEIWNFLSRIIPKSNSADTLTINGSKITIIYTDSDFLSHLSLNATLQKLKDEKLIKDFKQSKISAKITGILTTFYETQIDLDGGIKDDVGVRIQKDPANGEDIFVPVSKDTAGKKESIDTVTKVRKFLNQNDPSFYEFLQFNK